MSTIYCGCDPEANYPCARYPACRKWPTFVGITIYPTSTTPDVVLPKTDPRCPYCDDAGRPDGCPACDR